MDEIFVIFRTTDILVDIDEFHELYTQTHNIAINECVRQVIKCHD